jgi:GDP-L-fucose synthase
MLSVLASPASKTFEPTITARQHIEIMERFDHLGYRSATREFLFVDDRADACIFVLEHYSGETHLNVGPGEDTTIAEFAQTVSDIVGYEGQLTFDTTRPDGSPQNLLDVYKPDAMGWRATTSLRSGLAAAYADFVKGGGRGLHDG